MENKIVEKGIGAGSLLALVISWSLNHSVIWALVHGLFNWGYVIYYLIKLKP